MSTTVPIIAAASIDQRFAQLIRQFGLTKNSFAISLGKTASVVQHLIDGRNKPGFDLMCKVFEVYPNVSRDWLLLGRGPMLVGSSGASLAPVVLPETRLPEPDFEPIDLADVAPRAARRTTGNRLHSDEIAAALALATAVADGVPAATAALPAPVAAAAAITAATAFSEINAFATPTDAAPLPAPSPGLDIPPVVTKTVQRPAQPYRPRNSRATEPITSSPVAAPAPVSVVAADAPAPPAAPRSIVPGEVLPGSLPVATNLGGPEAYVAAAIHAQHFQHQLALAELRNQHLLEQQQMLREMLAMARQDRE